jgi:hypothetical protein
MAMTADQLKEQLQADGIPVVHVDTEPSRLVVYLRPYADTDAAKAAIAELTPVARVRYLITTTVHLSVEMRP